MTDSTYALLTFVTVGSVITLLYMVLTLDTLCHELGHALMAMILCKLKKKKQFIKISIPVIMGKNINFKIGDLLFTIGIGFRFGKGTGRCDFENLNIYSNKEVALIGASGEVGGMLGFILFSALVSAFIPYSTIMTIIAGLTGYLSAHGFAVFLAYKKFKKSDSLNDVHAVLSPNSYKILYSSSIF